MAFSVTSFKEDGLPLGGYRPSLFEVQCTYAGQQLNMLANASQVPAMTMGLIEVPYFGRKIKLAGDRTYAEWTTVLFMEEDPTVRDTLEQWQMDMNKADTNERALVNESYKKDAEVFLYGKDGSIFRTYSLKGCWPSDVGTIELDWGNNDALATYSVTWQFDYMDKGA